MLYLARLARCGTQLASAPSLQTLACWVQGFHVVLSDMCHSTMGSSSADVLRSLDLASCAAALAVGPLEPEANSTAQLEPQLEWGDEQHTGHEQGPAPAAEAVPSNSPDHVSGLLLPQGHLVMKLLQVSIMQEHQSAQV